MNDVNKLAQTLPVPEGYLFFSVFRVFRGHFFLDIRSGSGYSISMEIKGR